MPTPRSSSGLFLSDRIPTHPPSSKQQQQGRGKGRGKVLAPEPPKSKAVRVLEARLDGARKLNGHTKDPTGGCFCLARHHVLSSYVTMCPQCGLILCILNPPYYACPHCSSALSDGRERVILVERLERELAEQLAKEETARQRVIEEARAAEGAFPMLPGMQAQVQASRTSPPGPATTRAVLSLNSETKRVTLSSYSTPTPSRPASRGKEMEEEWRMPKPSEEVSYVKAPWDPERPWKNVRLGDTQYISLPGGTSKRDRKLGG